jgi:uncharacterized protein
MGSDRSLPKFRKIGGRHFLIIIIIVILCLLNASVAVAYVEAKSSAITVLHVNGAPENIVFIADPHLKEGNIAQIRTIVDEINALNPSIVLIGGDLVSDTTGDFHLQEVWKGINAPVYTVLGNHDYKAGINATTWVTFNVSNLRDGSTDLAYADRLTAELGKEGVTVLRNQYVMVDAGGQQMMLVGIDDGWAGMADPPVVPPAGAFTIYMIHEPSCRADWDADLIFAGHTHGGQFLPPNTTLLGLELSGLVKRNGVNTYITRGIGTSDFNVDLRLFATPEIVVINPTTSPDALFPDKKVDHIIIG